MLWRHQIQHILSQIFLMNIKPTIMKCCKLQYLLLCTIGRAASSFWSREKRLVWVRETHWAEPTLQYLGARHINSMTKYLTHLYEVCSLPVYVYNPLSGESVSFSVCVCLSSSAFHIYIKRRLQPSSSPSALPQPQATSPTQIQCAAYHLNCRLFFSLTSWSWVHWSFQSLWYWGRFHKKRRTTTTIRLTNNFHPIIISTDFWCGHVPCGSWVSEQL